MLGRFLTESRNLLYRYLAARAPQSKLRGIEDGPGSVFLEGSKFGPLVRTKSRLGAPYQVPVAIIPMFLCFLLVF